MFMTPSYSVPFDPRNAESESSDDSDDEDTRAPAKSVDLTLTALNSLHTLNESPDQSTFATHGVDRDRLSSLSKHPPCECKCRVPLVVLQKTCQSFWRLPKQSQDALLWSLQVQEGSSRRTWSIEGPHVQYVNQHSLFGMSLSS